MDSDTVLLKLLSIFSAKKSGIYLRLNEKLIAFIVKVISSIFILYIVFTYSFNICTSKHFDAGPIVRILMSVQFALLCNFLSTQIDNIFINLQQLRNYKVYLKIPSNGRNLVKTIALTLIFLPVVMSVVIFIWENRDSHYVYSYGYEIHDKVIVRVLIAFGNFTYFFCCTLFTLISFSLSILLFRWGEVLNCYNENLISNIKIENNNGKPLFLKKFFKILKSIERLEKIL